MSCFEDLSPPISVLLPAHVQLLDVCDNFARCVCSAVTSYIREVRGLVGVMSCLTSYVPRTSRLVVDWLDNQCNRLTFNMSTEYGAERGEHHGDNSIDPRGCRRDDRIR